MVRTDTCAPAQRTWLCVAVIALTSVALAQGVPSIDNSVLEGLVWRGTTEAFNREALRILIEDASRLARDLALQEALPIQKSNLVSQGIFPPGWSDASGWFGSIDTANYSYAA